MASKKKIQIDSDDQGSEPDFKDPKQGVLFKALQEGADKEEPEPQKVEKEPKKDEPKTIPKKEEEKKVQTPDDDKDFDPVSFDESKGADGKPFSSSTTETFKKFKESAKKRDELIQSLKKELEDAKKVKVDELPEYKTALKERDEARSILETEYFYNSPEFIKKYNEPLKKAEAKVKTMISAIPEEDVASVRDDIIKANEYLSAVDETKFFEYVDKIAEEVYTPTNARKFVSAMQELFEATSNMTDAYRDKEEASKKIKESKGANAKSSYQDATKYIDISADRFKSDNKTIIDMYESNEDLKKEFDYTAELSKDVESAKEQLSEFLATGKISQELSEFIYRGSILRTREHEIKTQSRVLGYQRDKIAELTKANEELKKEVDSLSSTDGRSKRVVNFDRGDKKVIKEGQSILANSMREVMER